MKQLNDQGKLPYAGRHSISGTAVSFFQYKPGEDFRNPWRTLANYMWYGPGQYTWNPTTYTYTIAPQNYELLNAQILTPFLRNPENYTLLGCEKIGKDPIQETTYKGTYLIRKVHNMDGTPFNSPEEERGVNNARGASMCAPVLTGETDLLAKLYRDVELHWDNRGVPKVPTLTDAQRNINGTESYMHGFFRLLGMLIATGNWHSPIFYASPVQANMKVYKAVSKTYAFTDDTIKYTISYRNYASVNATGVRIQDVLPPELEFVSASNGGTYTGGIVTWNLGTVSGFNSATGIIPTQGKVTMICRVKSNVPTGARVCNTATISCTNGTGWTSNEYPNNVTPVMERNCVDIVGRAFEITKEVDKPIVNPNDIVEFKITFKNSTDAGWLNGGRPGVNVTHAYGYAGVNSFMMFYRIFHGADEPYIDYGNYRISYYLNNPSVNGFYPAYANGWVFKVNFMEGGDPTKVKFDFQKVPYGSETISGINRKWDQRLICKFPNSLGALSQHLYQKWSEYPDIHKGAYDPFRTQLQLELPTSSPIDPVINDSWSYDGISSFLSGYNDKSPYYPITPDWTDVITYPAGKLVDRVHPDVCETRPNYSRVLVEEWDGYTWRRVLGRGPLPGREQYNVVVVDTVPANLEFVKFTDNEALGIIATYDATKKIIKWQIPTFLVGSIGDLRYEAKALGTCPMTDKDVRNWAWIFSSTESPLGDYADVKITCNVVPPPSSKTSIYKSSDKNSYVVGEEITYTLAYKQTQGTQAVGNVSSGTNWTTVSGTSTFNATNLGLSSNAFIYQQYSHGTDGEFDIYVNNTNSNDIFSVVLRYESGTPNTASFDGVGIQIHPGPWGKNSGALIAVVDGNTVISSTPGFVTYADPTADTLKIHISLKGSEMKVWLNKNYLTDAPILTTTGLRIQPGYIGMVNGLITANAFPSYAGGVGTSNSITYWKSNFDSAFDIKLSDLIPSGTSFIPSSIVVNYNQLGKFTSLPNFNTNSVLWNLFANPKMPILYGDSVKYQFKVKVEECFSGYITNILYANLYSNPANKTINATNQVTCSTTLPVSLLSYSGKASNTGNLLNWVSLSEKDTYGYYIEKSSNGIQFVTIEFVLANNTHAMNEYTYIDQNTGNAFYRLRIQDINGSSENSNTIFLSQNSLVSIFPLPSNNTFTVKVQSPEVFHYQIYSSSGQLVEKGTANQSVTVGNEYAQGVYTIQVITGDEVVVRKLVKE
ncbi:MAG: T9SS type A sorting domain-containing protein [Cytophagaceae bacterium]|jgi:uncharacterized repeat protein (TIGR01451 family)|nr:T9SS type A sorting domain-containing protein [Cytophagaceae bacterium]